MSQAETALYIGRFQPFHNGHLDALNQIQRASDIDQVVVGIAATQYHHYLNNPFTVEERREMIAQSVRTEKGLEIVEIPDINNDDLWVEHVANLAPPFHITYSENPWVQRLFKDQGYAVRGLERNDPISASLVRRRMLLGEDWQDLVPEGTLAVVEKARGVQRLREINSRYLKPSVTVDTILTVGDRGLVLIERGADPFKGSWALPGGHVDADLETTEQAAAREAWEETNLSVSPEDLDLVGAFSRPGRDPRGPYISLCFSAHLAAGEPLAGDDAKSVKLFPFDSLPKELAFDHKNMIKKFLQKKGGPYGNGTN